MLISRHKLSLQKDTDIMNMRQRVLKTNSPLELVDIMEDIRTRPGGIINTVSEIQEPIPEEF